MEASETLSRRQKLKELTKTGDLRAALNRASVDDEVTDLVVDLCLRYCESKRRRPMPGLFKPNRATAGR